MTIEEIRRDNTRFLMTVFCKGKSKDFAIKINRTTGFVSQIIGKNPTKEIGSKVASTIEKAFDRREGWLDRKIPVAEKMELMGYAETQNNSKRRQSTNEVPLFNEAGTRLLSAKHASEIMYEKMMFVPDALITGSFAITMPDNSMEAVNSMERSIPRNSVLYIEPVNNAVNELSSQDIVLAHYPDASYVIRNYINDAGDILLIPANNHYRTRNIDDGTITGKVKSIYINLEK